VSPPRITPGKGAQSGNTRMYAKTTMGPNPGQFGSSGFGDTGLTGES
jgi:hypothetical protein